MGSPTSHAAYPPHVLGVFHKLNTSFFDPDVSCATDQIDRMFAPWVPERQCPCQPSPFPSLSPSSSRPPLPSACCGHGAPIGARGSDCCSTHGSRGEPNFSTLQPWCLRSICSVCHGTGSSKPAPGSRAGRESVSSRVSSSYASRALSFMVSARTRSSSSGRHGA